MTRIGVRELRQHASRYLDQVKAGETLEVSERGRLVALLVPPSPALSARDQLLSAGRLVPARLAFALPRRRIVAAGMSGSAALDDLREDRGG